MKHSSIIPILIMGLCNLLYVWSDCDFRAGSCCPSSVGSVIIANTVTIVPANAFSGCTTLTNITFAEPSIVSLLGDNAFKLSSLTLIAIPNSVTIIGNEVFYACNGLISVIIPDSVTLLGIQVFSSCNGLTSVTIGSGLATLPDFTFAYCSGLLSITIPNTVKSLGIYVFLACGRLKSVHIGNGLTTLPDYTFAYCVGLINITVPKAVTSLGTDVFLAAQLLLQLLSQTILETLYMPMVA